MTTYRKDIAKPPIRMRKLPIVRGYPVPWFVQHLGNGNYDFRVMDANKIVLAATEGLCWLCGQPLPALQAVFVVGPMCTINRISAEPPSHKECAEYAVVACPFLNQRQKKRRPVEADLAAVTSKPAGEMIERQPGATCLWQTARYRTISVDEKWLFKMGKPRKVSFYREGRKASQEEVVESIVTGLPILFNSARRDGRGAVEELIEKLKETTDLLGLPRQAIMNEIHRRAEEEQA